MTSSIAQADESMPHGAGRGVLSAAKAALLTRDAKGQKARSKDSSGGSRKTNILRNMSKRTLLKELLREAEDQKRIDARERKARWRQRQGLKRAVAAAAEGTNEPN